MTTNIKIAWGVVSLIIIVLVGLYAYPNAWKVSSSNSASNQIGNSFILQGTVSDVYPDKLQIIVSKNSVEKTVFIDPSTKIERSVLQNGANGAVEKQLIAEVNISDIQKGNMVLIQYQSEKDSVLNGVSQIAFVVDGNVDTYTKQALSPDADTYLKGSIVSIDSTGKTLQYKPYLVNVIGTETITVAIPDGIKVYRVDDPARVAILHARIPAPLSDLLSGRIVFLLADPAALKQGKIVPQAFIVVGT